MTFRCSLSLNTSICLYIPAGQGVTSDGKPVKVDVRYTKLFINGNLLIVLAARHMKPLIQQLSKLHVE